MKDKRLAGNSLLNLLAAGLPLIAALFSIPVILKTLGQERFGVLTIVWVVIGYFSLFDFGLTRATTREVAANLAKGRALNSVRNLKVIKTSVVALLAIGLITSAITFIFAEYFAIKVLHIAADLQHESLNSIRILALAIPAVTLSAVLTGVLEGQQNFLKSTLIRTPLGILNFCVPAVIGYFGGGLVQVTLALTLLRYIFLILLYWFSLGSLSGLLVRMRATSADFKRLLRIGGWISVSNMISPIMIYADRLILASVSSIGNLAYYSTPSEVINKILIVPQAVTSAAFPIFSAAFHQRDSKANRAKAFHDVYSRTNTLICVLVIPPVALFFFLAPELLALWLGADFSANASSICKWIAVGVLANALARAPFTAIQAIGRPDITAKLHLIEFPLYILLLIPVAGKYGAIGAAFCWAFRAAVDALAHSFMLNLVSKSGLFRMRNIVYIALPMIAAALPVYKLAFSARVGAVAIISTFAAIGLIRTLQAKMNDGVSIVVVTFNPQDELLECYRSILEWVQVPFELIIVDNSPAPTQPIIELQSSSVENLRFLSLPENPGYGTAINAGVKESFFSNILILNPDTVLTSPISVHLLSKLTETTGLLCGQCTDSERVYKQTVGIFPLEPLSLFVFKNRLKQNDGFQSGSFDKEAYEIDYAEGSLYLLKKSCFNAVDGFDENIFLYGEDYEFSYRIHKAGYVNLYVPSLTYTHIGGFTPRREPHIAKGLVYFSKKHTSRYNVFLTKSVLLLRYALIYLVSIAKGNKERSSFAKQCLSSVVQS